MPGVERKDSAGVVAVVEPLTDEGRARRDLDAAVKDPARAVAVEIEGVDIPVRRAEVGDAVPNDGRRLGASRVVAPTGLPGLQVEGLDVAGLHCRDEEEPAVGVDRRRGGNEGPDAALPEDSPAPHGDGVQPTVDVVHVRHSLPHHGRKLHETVQRAVPDGPERRAEPNGRMNLGPGRIGAIHRPLRRPAPDADAGAVAAQLDAHGNGLVSRRRDLCPKRPPLGYPEGRDPLPRRPSDIAGDCHPRAGNRLPAVAVHNPDGDLRRKRRSGGRCGSHGSSGGRRGVAAGVGAAARQEGGQEYERRPERSAKQEENHDPVETTG